MIIEYSAYVDCFNRYKWISRLTMDTHISLLMQAKVSQCSLSNVVWDLLTYEICIHCIINNGIELAFVPQRFCDFCICLTAVRNQSLAITYVPDKFKRAVLQLIHVPYHPK